MDDNNGDLYIFCVSDKNEGKLHRVSFKNNCQSKKRRRNKGKTNSKVLATIPKDIHIPQQPAVSLFVNGTYHLIVTHKNRKKSPLRSRHFVWDPSEGKKLHRQHKFDDDHSRGKLLYNKSRNRLLLVSCSPRTPPPHSWQYHTIIPGIWDFCLSGMYWSRITDNKKPFKG